MKRLLVALLALDTLTACGSGSGTDSSSQGGTIELTNVSYDPTRELYAAYNKIFEQHYEESTGKKIEVTQSHGGSGKQALEVSNGLEADVVTPADRVDASRIPTLLTGLLLVAYLVIHFTGGGSLTLYIVNWSFLTLIMLLVRNPFELIALTKQAATNVGEILLQFPLYAGILGIMAGTGLMTVISEAFVAISNQQTFALFAFLSAGLVNFFVPSGGGQIAVQAPILLEAAESLGTDPAVAIMAVAYGDQWTNMIQPFWALPLLAIAGLKMRDILGYTTITLIASGIVFGGALVLVSL